MLTAALLIACGCVLLDPVSSAGGGPVPKPLVGRWLAEDIDGGGVIDFLQTTLEINDDGTYTGFAGCNSYTGMLLVKEKRVTFGTPGTTHRVCAPAVMDQDRKFLNLLRDAHHYDVEDGKLLLRHTDGKIGAGLSLTSLVQER